MKTKKELFAWLVTNQNRFIDMANAIWRQPEVAWEEREAARIQINALESGGFRITKNVAEMETAFVAEWGEGKPVLGFLGEYDALAGLSQHAEPTKQAIVESGPGHGCGHNLLGTGCLAAAVVAKEWLESNQKSGTVRYYGCPAEERVAGKVFMARAGMFDDLDCGLNYHPDSINMPGKGSAVGVTDLTFRFHGRTAHAGGAPHQGRSALDAVELMNVGVNYLREHVTEKVRIHYAITHGGDVPNIVPEEAEVWYFLRAPNRPEMKQLLSRVRKVAEGAALMTETSVEMTTNGACSSVLNNHYLADLHYDAMKLIGPIQYTEDDLSFARKLNDGFPAENARNRFRSLRVPEAQKDRVAGLEGKALIGENFPSMDEENIGTGSTDVGDVSWITPLCMLRTTCFPTGAASHSWGVAAASGMSIGHKGMMHAAKIMAAVAVDLYSDPIHIERAREEWAKKTMDQPYSPPIPDDLQPPRV